MKLGSLVRLPAITTYKIKKLEIYLLLCCDMFSSV